jgi:hypothetical protein
MTQPPNSKMKNTSPFLESKFKFFFSLSNANPTTTLSTLSPRLRGRGRVSE